MAEVRTSTQSYLTQVVERYPPLKECIGPLYAATEAMIDCFRRGTKLLACGNGGSAADCEHVVGELMKAFLLRRHLEADQRLQLQTMYPQDAGYLIANLQRALPAISLVSQTALMTAFGNDVSADMIFAQQVLSYGQPGDILLAISTSGNSKNIVYAAQIARLKKLTVLSLMGRKNGQLKDYSDIAIQVPSEVTYQIQEYHLPIYHCLCACVENEFFGLEL